MFHINEYIRCRKPTIQLYYLHFLFKFFTILIKNSSLHKGAKFFGHNKLGSILRPMRYWGIAYGSYKYVHPVCKTSHNNIINFLFQFKNIKCFLKNIFINNKGKSFTLDKQGYVLVIMRYYKGKSFTLDKQGYVLVIMRY